MFYQRELRRQQHAINPFVVLSDVTIAVILILLFYFTALVFTLRRHIVGIESEKARRVQMVTDYQQQVARVLSDPRLQSYRGQISVHLDGDDQVFTFGEQVLFPRGSAHLSAHGTQVLLAFGSALGRVLNREVKKFYSYPEIQVLGHTDTIPADNWTLSMNRALAVVKVFSQQGGLWRAHLSAAGYSCHRPRVAPRVGKDQPPNRRIEVRLLYNTRDIRSQTFVPNAPYECDCYR